MRERARELGYAIAVHGTLAYDIDLIAVPWVDSAVEPKELAEALRQVAEEINGVAFPHPLEQSEWFQGGMPRAKPHGRLCWSFHLGGGPYIDLSVMPLTSD